MQAIKKSLLSFGKLEVNTLLVTLFLSLLTLSTFIIGYNGIIFLGAIIICAFFIYQTPAIGLHAALLTTMIFGEHFSLLPLQINETLYKIYALDFILIITFVCWFLKQKVGSLKFKEFFKARKNIWLSVFLFFILLNLMRSIFFTATDTALAMGTFKNYIYILVYFLVVLMLDSKKKLLYLIKTFLWGGIAMLGFVIYGLISGHGLWSEITPGIRYLSGLHSYYITFPIIILLILIVYRQYIFGYLKTLGIFLLQVVGLISGMFRHLWLGMTLAVLGIVSFLHFDKKVNFIKLGIIILLIAVSASFIVLWLTGLMGSEQNFLQDKFFQSISGRAQSLFYTGHLSESAAGWRLATWQTALNKFVSNPLFGIGFGQKFYFEYRGFVDLVDIRNIHNDFASLLVQLGLLGWLPFILFNFYQLKDLWPILKKEDGFYKPLGLMLLGFWIIAITGIFFAIYLMFNGTSIFYWTVMASVTVLINLYHKKI